MIVNFINILYIAFICYAFYHQKTIHKRKRKHVQVKARLNNKAYHRIMQIEFGVPIFYDKYEMTFLIDNKEKTFETSRFENDVVEIGDEGILVYEPYKIISFSDKIKEFHFDEE